MRDEITCEAKRNILKAVELGVEDAINDGEYFFFMDDNGEIGVLKIMQDNKGMYYGVADRIYSIDEVVKYVKKFIDYINEENEEEKDFVKWFKNNTYPYRIIKDVVKHKRNITIYFMDKKNNKKALKIFIDRTTNDVETVLIDLTTGSLIELEDIDINDVKKLIEFVKKKLSED